MSAEAGGPTWRQTIFYPILHASRFGRGEVLEARVDSPGYELPGDGPVPWLEAVAVARPGEDEIALFAVNRHPRERLSATVRLGGGGECRPIEHLVLAHPDPLAVNDRDNPARVVPHRSDGVTGERENLIAILPPYSWNVVRIKTGAGHGRSEAVEKPNAVFQQLQ